MTDLRKKLLGIFQTEHAEHVGQIRSLVALLENVQGGAARPELNEAFRRAHTLKGAARAVDLRPIESLAHRLETLFARVSDGSILLDSHAVSTVHSILNCSEDCMAALASGKVSPDWHASIQTIDDLLATDPSRAPHEEPAFPQNEVSAPGAAEDVSVEVAETVRLSGDSLERLLRSSARITEEVSRQNRIGYQLTSLVRGQLERQRAIEHSRSSAAPLLRDAGTPVVNYVALLRQQLQLLEHELQCISQAHAKSFWELQSRAAQLQRDAREARVIPVEQTLNGFGKMVRDLARDQGKKVRFQVTGGQIRADRLVLQALKDPIMHVLRNAVSHGIEHPEERAARGKNPEGIVSVRIGLERRQLIVRVEDDGRGFDFAAVARVAVAKGLLPEEAARLQSHKQLTELVFHPGFSTSDRISDLSGRGMGLSVVQETVRRLQGHVSIDTQGDGAGGSILLSVPLTIAAAHLLAVSCANQSFAFPTHSIEHLYRIPKQSIEYAENRPRMRAGEQTIPLVSLSDLLGSSSKPAVFPDCLTVVHLRAGRKSVGLVVDSFQEEMHASMEDLGMPLVPRYVAGGAVRDDGSIAIVLNPPDLIELCSGLPPSAFPDGSADEGKQRPLILVVDDSITTRTLEKDLLESYGYDVRLAIDGLQALEVLRTEKPAAILTDLEMPGLDGFGLLQAIKADKNLNGIPVIIVSSRADAQKRGLELGADAYIIKSKFDARELLQVIQQVL